MQKKTKAVYAVAVVTALILYVAGIFTGVYVQQSVSDSVENDLSAIRGDIESQQQQLLLLNLQGKESCSILRSLSSITAMKLDSVSNEIRRLESLHSSVQFAKLKESYSTLSIQAWIVMSSINKNCDEKTASILYYYSFPCEKCLEQEAVFEQIKSVDRERILTYAVDIGVNNSLVQILVASHNVVSAPSIVFGDTMYQGPVNITVLSGLVCNSINLTCPARNTSLTAVMANNTNLTNGTSF